MKRTSIRILLGTALLLGGSIASAEEALTKTTATPAQPDVNQQAIEVMRTAHDARETWDNFPGFTADLTVQTDASVDQGDILVTKDFDYELSISDEAIQPWVNSKLRSVIGHRRSSDMVTEISLGKQESSPEFGTFITRNDGSGTFRIEKGLIREVHRKTDSLWIEITNVEMFDAGDGKVLPETTSVTHRDRETGDIIKNRTNRFTWTKVGDFFLPETSFTVETGTDGSRQIRELTFTNHKLTDEQGQEQTLGSTSRLHKPLPESPTRFGAP